MRRLFRWAFNGSCLLSLLACLTMACLWRRSYLTFDRVFFSTSSRTLLRLTSSRGSAGLMSARDWPVREPLTWLRSSDFSDAGSLLVMFGAQDVWHNWKRLGIKGYYGTGHAARFDASGNLLLYFPSDAALGDDTAESGPVPEWELYVPDWMPAGLTAFLPLFWVGLRLRRGLTMRQRRRSGRCLNCGHHLPANAAGDCPRCAAVAAARLTPGRISRLAFTGAGALTAVLVRMRAPALALGRTKSGRMMRRVFRWLVTAAMAGSFVLCAAVAVIWVRSYWVADWVSRVANDDLPWGKTSLGSERGEFLLFRNCCRGYEPQGMRWKIKSGAFRGRDPCMYGDWGAGLAGFHFSTAVSDGIRERAVMLPDWAPFFLLLVLPASWFVGRIARRRIRKWRREGRCMACGFDLRASPGRCPECGAERGETGRSGFGWAPRLSVAVTVLLAGGTAALAWWSNPARGASPGPGANPDQDINYYPVWEPPHGMGGDRMLQGDPTWDQKWHQSLCHRADRGDTLVIVRDMGVCLFSEFWQVRVFDRSMHLLREGQVGLGANGCAPYQLVEIRTSDPSLPAEYRGQWDLAVESVPPAKFRETSPDGRQTAVGRDIVEWDKTSHIPSDDWRHASDLEVRSAEPPPER